MSARACQPGVFTPRPVTFRGVHHHEGWALKLCCLSAPGITIDWPAYERALTPALRAHLPMPARTELRAGVGFVIAHQGAEAQYLVINWWHRHNELFTRTLVRAAGSPPETSFREARDEHSICVWDLEIIWRERNAYVETMMAARPDVEGYLHESA